MQCDSNLIRRNSDYSTGNEAEVFLVCLALGAEMWPRKCESYATNTLPLKATVHLDSGMITYGQQVCDYEK